MRKKWLLERNIDAHIEQERLKRQTGVCYGKGGGSAPPPPDYAGAAQATAAGNADAARIGAKANRVSQYTPYGNLIYTPGQNGDPDQWRADISLSDAQKQLLDINNQSSIKSGQLANQGLDYAGQILGKPGFDESMTPRAPVSPGQTAYDATMSRLTPQLDREKTSLDTQLINQGLRPGGEAYDNAMKLQNQKANDMQTQAASSTIPLDYQARQQAIQEQAFQQNQPVNIINAMRTGSQVQNPNFINPANQVTTAGPDYLGAATSQYGQQLGAYNAQQANSSNQTNGLLSAAGTAASIFF